MHLELSVSKVYSTLIIALFCISAFCCGCWKMYNVLCITKAIFCFSFFGHLGGWQCCHFHLPTRGEWFDVSLITCSSVLISTVTAPQSLPLQDSACSSNMRKGALLKCGTTEFRFLKKNPTLPGPVGCMLLCTRRDRAEERFWSGPSASMWDRRLVFVFTN